MAGVYKGLTIKLAADTTGLSQALNGIDRQTRGLKREMNAVNKALKLDPKNTELARQKMEVYQKEIQQASNRLKTLKEAESQIGKGGMSSDAWNTLQRDIASTQGRLAQMTSEYKAFTVEQAAATSGLGKAGAALVDLGAKLDPAAAALGSAGSKMSAAVTAPAVAAGVASTKIAMDFETSLAKVSTLADESAMSMDKIGEGSRELAVKYGKSASEINEALYQAMSASVDTAHSLEFVDQATRLSKAGFTESATAVDVLTTSINAYGMKADDAAHISDVLVNTQNLGKTTVNELAASMGNVIPTAAAYGVNLENLASAYAVMTKQGINTANSTTYINGMLTELASESSTVNGVIQEMSGKTFGELMKSGASLGDVIAMLNEHVGGNSEEFANLWGNVRAGKGALAIANGGAGAFNDTLDSMVNSAGTVDEAMDKLGGTTQAQMAKAKAEVEDAAIAVGQVLLPYVSQAAGAVKAGADAFNSLSDGEKEAIVKTAALAAGIGPVLVLLSKAMGLVGSFGGGLTSLAKGLAAVDLATNGTAKGFKAAAKAGEDMSKKAMAASVAMGAAKTAAVALAVAGVVVLVSAIKSYLENLAQVDRATRGLVSETRGLKSASDVAATGLDKQAASAETAAEAVEGYRKAALDATKAGAELADSVAEIIKGAETDAGTAQAYVDTIKELAGNCGGSAEKVAELKGAVDAYNELTGSSIAVVDDYSGRINANTEELQANTEAFKENAYAKAAQEVYQETVKHEIEVTNALEAERKKREQLADAVKKAEEESRSTAGKTQEEIQQDRQTAADLERELGELDRSILSLERDQTAAAQASEIARESVGEYKTEAEKAAEAAKRAALSTDDFRKAFADLGAEGGFDELAASLGTDVDALTDALKQAGVGTDELARIGLENFNRLREGAGNDFGAVANAIAVIDALGIDPKVVEVDDSGVVTAEGHIVDLKSQTIDGKQFKVSDDGSISVVADELGKVDQFEIGGKTVKVGVEDNASSHLDEIKGKVDNLGNATISVNVSHSGGFATGGLLPEPVRMPRHADGGITGVVTRAIVTNQGLVGEDGAEYVHDYGDGSAIVPIENSRYTRPLAKEIAREMPVQQQGGKTVNLQINGAQINNDAAIEAKVYDLLDTVERKRQMG